ncbi:MAG: hypothetical protein QOD76_1563 [Solirubrobacteraceae bacterium]|nr:hypothetical protein [Solirubrobacteraceae bacterium]
MRSFAIALLGLLLLAAPARAGEWVAGDLHVHTTYSHDSYGGPGDDNTGPDEAYTLGHSVTSQFAIAASRGLQYMAITDHNDIRSQSDPGFGAFGVIPVPAYENSLRGHAQMLGAHRLYANGDGSAAAVSRLAAALRADGGVFQVNHPIDPLWALGYAVTPDTVEAWNLPWYYQPPFPAASDNDRALSYWQGWLDRGDHVGVTGGSDNHWVSTTALQGAGQPTTWVFVRARTVAGILEGLRAGRTFVSHEPPAYGGQQLFLEGDRDGDGHFESMVGDTLPAGATLRVRATGAVGATVRVVTDHGAEAFPPMVVTSNAFEHRFKVPSTATWAHAQLYGEDGQSQRGCNAVVGADGSQLTTYCSNRIAMLALSSAVYLARSQTGAVVSGTAHAGGASLVAPSVTRVGSGCLRRPFRAYVTGARVVRVRFRIDHGAWRTVRRRDRRGRFVIVVDTRGLSRGRHRIDARAVTRSRRGRAPHVRRLRVSFRLCG